MAENRIKKNGFLPMMAIVQGRDICEGCCFR